MASTPLHRLSAAASCTALLISSTDVGRAARRTINESEPLRTGTLIATPSNLSRVVNMRAGSRVPSTHSAAGVPVRTASHRRRRHAAARVSHRTGKQAERSQLVTGARDRRSPAVMSVRVIFVPSLLGLLPTPQPLVSNRHAAGHFAETLIGAPLSFTKITRNLAGAVWLAFRLTMCSSSGPS